MDSIVTENVVKYQNICDHQWKSGLKLACIFVPQRLYSYMYNKKNSMEYSPSHLHIKWSFTRRSDTSLSQPSSLMHSRQRVQDRGLTTDALFPPN